MFKSLHVSISGEDSVPFKYASTHIVPILFKFLIWIAVRIMCKLVTTVLPYLSFIIFTCHLLAIAYCAPVRYVPNFHTYWPLMAPFAFIKFHFFGYISARIS